MTELVLWAIIGLFIINLILFGILIYMSNSIKKKLKGYLINVVKGCENTPDVDNSQSLDQVIDAHIKTIKDGLMTWTKGEKEKILMRMEVKEESKHQYVDLNTFGILYSFARGIIEVFPLLGILGTVIAIGYGLGGDDTIEASEKIKNVIGYFKNSVGVTAAGIFSAIIFILINAFFEPVFEKLITNKSKVNDLLSEAKKTVRLSAAPFGSGQ